MTILQPKERQSCMSTSQSPPAMIGMVAEICLKNHAAKKVSVSMPLEDLSEATEDRLCEILREQVQSLFSSARSLAKTKGRK